jgi:DNA transposition AAA+ family ATPase
MIETFVETKNTVRLNQMYAALAKRERGVPGFGLVYGMTGLGKTRAVESMAASIGAVYVRCETLWTPISLCEAQYLNPIAG